MKDQIVKIIFDYLTKVEVPREKWDGTVGFFPAEWPLPTCTIADEIAEQLAAAITPHLEAGEVLKPTKFEKDHLPDDVKLLFHKGVGLYQCIQNYELGVITRDEFIGDIRKVESDFK